MLVCLFWLFVLCYSVLLMNTWVPTRTRIFDNRTPALPTWNLKGSFSRETQVVQLLCLCFQDVPQMLRSSFSGLAREAKAKGNASNVGCSKMPASFYLFLRCGIQTATRFAGPKLRLGNPVPGTAEPTPGDQEPCGAGAGEADRGLTQVRVSESVNDQVKHRQGEQCFLRVGVGARTSLGQQTARIWSVSNVAELHTRMPLG